MNAKAENERIHSQLPIGLASVIAAVVFSGIAHGYLDGRWSVDSDRLEQGAKIEQLPNRCGTWAMVEQSELDASAARVLRCFGSTVREYVNESTGDRVNVAVLFGPRGPTSVHIPEVCMDSVGTDPVGERSEESIVIGDQRHTFWSSNFSRDGSPEASDNVWYAWSDGAEWIAGKYPRFWLTETLYKIQVAGPAMPGEVASPCREFLTAFLPQLETIKQAD
jgi:hypothetical protein